MDPSLHEFFARQDNLITREQSLDVMTVGRLKHLLANRWRRVLPGIYAGFTGTLNERQRRRAALLYAGESAQLGDVTALDEVGLRCLPPVDRVHILIPAANHRASSEFVVVRRTHRLPEATILRGLPVCPPERALVEAVKRLCDPRFARAAMSEAIQRGIAKPTGLLVEEPHLSGRGAGIARAAIADIAIGARSAPEADFLDLCRECAALPLPLLNPLLQLPCGRHVSPDALWPEAGLVHETNGRAHHARVDLFEDMQSRSDAMTAAGLIVLHNSPRQLLTEKMRVLREVRACHDRYDGRGLPAGVVLLRPGPPGTPHVT